MFIFESTGLVIYSNGATGAFSYNNAILFFTFYHFLLPNVVLKISRKLLILFDIDYRLTNKRTFIRTFILLQYPIGLKIFNTNSITWIFFFFIRVIYSIIILRYIFKLEFETWLTSNSGELVLALFNIHGQKYSINEVINN